MVDIEQIEKERTKLKSRSNGILNDYLEVNGLESVLDLIFDFSYSKAFKDLIKDIEHLLTIYNKGEYCVLHVPEDIAKDIPQIKYSQDVLFSNKWSLIIPKKFKGEIDTDHYTALIVSVVVIQSFTGEDNSHKKVFDLSHKIMSLLYDFDKNIPFNEPDKDYFIKLRNLKWNKDAKKLLKRISKFHDKIVSFCCHELLSEDPNMNYPVIMGLFNGATLNSLIFLSGCSAVNNGRDTMGFDDVICASKTFFKLLDLINLNYSE